MVRNIAFITCIIMVCSMQRGLSVGSNHAAELMASAQTIDTATAADILRSLNLKFEKSKYLSVNIRQKVFAGYWDTVANQIYDGYFHKSNQKQHSVTLGIETIINEKYRLVIDTNTKSVMLQKAPSQNLSNIQNVSALLGFCRSITTNALSDGMQLLSLDLTGHPETGLSKLDIYYTSETLKKLVMFHSESMTDDQGNATGKPRIEISYFNMITNSIPHAEFEMDHVIRWERGVPKLQPQYRNYTLLNQIYTNQ